MDQLRRLLIRSAYHWETLTLDHRFDSEGWEKDPASSASLSRTDMPGDAEGENVLSSCVKYQRSHMSFLVSSSFPKPSIPSGFPRHNHRVMAQKHLIADLSCSRPESLRIAYLDYTPPAHVETRGIILLIHGFPQTSYQFRHALPLLADHGYRCIAPDYRGAGSSSKPLSDYRKSTMAADMIALLDHLEILDPIHVVGHDIGGMIAFSIASRWPQRVKSVCWGECPLPGTQTYYKDRTEDAVQQFHFIFHSVPDLPEALIAGRERVYITHFFSKITYNLDAFSDVDVDEYERAYSQPGAIRCALDVYRAFEDDAKENTGWVASNGKCTVPTLVLSGENSRHRHDAQDMALEVTEGDQVEVGLVRDAAHYLAEENPRGFVEVVLDFVRKHE